MGGDATDDLVLYWAAQHTLVLWRGRPRALVQAATHAVLARLRAFRAADDLVAWPELSDREEAALIRSLLPDAPDALVQQIRGAARHLRLAELAAGEW